MNTTTELEEALESRLNQCPMCGARGAVNCLSDGILITCERDGCRTVKAATSEDAVKLWNEPRRFWK